MWLKLEMIWALQASGRFWIITENSDTFLKKTEINSIINVSFSLILTIEVVTM